jgi:RNase adapter protein RapZ
MNEPVAPARGTAREVVFITGMSGSGKSVALHALEDAGFFCVDNLPPELLQNLVRLEHEHHTDRIAVAADVRTAGSLPAVVPVLDALRGEGITVRPLFLDATTEALVRRFSETRRPHPLANVADGSDGQHALIEALELERALLAELREVSTVIDTSQLRPAQLRKRILTLVGARASTLTLVFESFAFKYGVPLDADYVFDVRMLPNPYYVKDLRQQNGRDAPVAAYLRQQPETAELVDHIHGFIARWLPNFEADQRSYLTVAVGCTGGQHRSVFVTEELGRRFGGRAGTLVRHRELEPD